MSKVLITCVGSGVGQSALDSLNLNREFEVIGCDSNRNVFAHSFCDDFYEVPSIYSEGYLDYLLKICITSEVDIIIPGHDHELLLFSKNIELFIKNNIKVIVSKPDLIEISRDKYLWYKYFIEYNCAIVPTFKVTDFKKNPNNSIFPAIVKPSGGSASQGIVILNNIEELDKANDSDIIQPYLMPTKEDANYDIILNSLKKGEFVQMSEISIQLIFSVTSELEGIFISNNVLKNGVPVTIDTILPDKFEYLPEILKIVEVCKSKKVIGPVNIQGRITDIGLVFFEMNMRFTGITGNRAILGFNEVSFLVNNFLGKESKLKGYSVNKIGVRQVACTVIPKTNDITKGNKIISILGAGSNVGREFINQLVKYDDIKKLYLIARPESFIAYLEKFKNDRIEIINSNDNFVESVFSQSDVVVNFVGALAFEPNKKQFDSILYQFDQINKIKKSLVPLVINVSSQSIYNQKESIQKLENSTINIDSTYSFQKHIVEKFIESIHDISPSIKTVSLRLSRVIGSSEKGAKPTGFFAMVIDSLSNDKEINIPFPQNSINLIDIKDVSRAIEHLIFKVNKHNLPSILNLGGENLTIRDYCNKVISTLDLSSKKHLINLSNNMEVQTTSLINCDKFYELGWEPSNSVEDMIVDMAKDILSK